MSPPDLCQKCKRPKAGPHDVIRWLSDTGRHGQVCWDGVDYPRITPEEEAVPDAVPLKKSLVEVRKQRDWLACLAVAGVTK